MRYDLTISADKGLRRSGPKALISAWTVSLAVHALLAGLLLTGFDRSGRADGFGEGGQAPIQLTAQFTSIDAPTSTALPEQVPVQVTVEPSDASEKSSATEPQARSSDAEANDAFAKQIAALEADRSREIVEEQPLAQPIPSRRRVTGPLMPPAESESPEPAEPSTDSLAMAGSPRKSTQATRSRPGAVRAGERFGHPNGASFFQIKAQGDSFCYVVDSSTSMDEYDSFAWAKAELLASLQHLDLRRRFQIIFYDAGLHPLLDGEKRTFAATDSHRKLARQFISTRQTGQGTQHKAALNLALQFKPDVIFLLTDGGTELSARDLDALRQLNRNRTPIHVIEFGRGARLGASWLEQLARDHRGSYRYFDVTAETDRETENENRAEVDSSDFRPG